MRAKKMTPFLMEIFFPLAAAAACAVCKTTAIKKGSKILASTTLWLAFTDKTPFQAVLKCMIRSKL